MKRVQKRWVVMTVFAVSMLLALSSHAQQQPMYSQYMFNMMNINPAYAGSRGVTSMTALFRDQWVNMPGSPKTASVSVDMAVKQKKIGLGLQLYDDRLGVERTMGLNLAYAFRIQTSEKGTLSLGLQAGILNYRANYTELSTFQSNDPVFSQNVNGILPAAGAGIYYNSDKFYIGASMPALLKTKINNNNVADVSSASGRDLHFFVTSGFVTDINEDLVLKPSIMIKSASGAPVELDLNMNLWIKNTIAVGGSYRTGDAYVGMVEWQMNRQLRFGYAYDKTFSNLGIYNNGTHELMLRLEIGQEGSKMVSPRYF
ncbi:MAG: type IX secretion system membrane protein PorP/SprF [Bacteroidota bacterium]|nr:type IX secretion system membrane protein PorP/SprF [Bacteroidota bacterium]